MGIDLGGTKIITGIMNHTGKIIGEPVRVSTPAAENADQIFGKMVNSIELSLKNSSLSIDSINSIGVGAPGPLNINEGMILTPPNLPTFHNFPLKNKLEKLFNLRVFINNDGNCFVLGETLFGAGKNCKIVFGITLGTGYGSGIVINNKIYDGFTGTASEIWCFPYRGGIIEDYVSGKSVQSAYRKLSGEILEPPEILENAKNGNDFALKTWKELGKHLGVSLAYVVNLIDPEIIVIGGSLSNAFNFFIESLKENLFKHVNPEPANKIKIKASHLGKYGGLIGAASLGFEH